MSRVERIARELAAAARAGEDVGDVLAAACSLAAARVGDAEALVNGRPGSWESEQVRALASSWPYVDEATRGPIRTPRGWFW
ncbi:MAG: hypothetical protein BGO37_10975 [Cellulomonas sp. 73-92]|uniref:hypothetical protein n=1 Tax=Cellulomonas sp. 73-92 TaxID=1895740 RepID=UPI00092894B5|nr:hypothetical protein [Cellulomonas sp. 73-92]OJV76564.1 MAG: hypothetical protein BGO37_10975 [Cellulomonas sp. 73-92]